MSADRASDNYDEWHASRDVNVGAEDPWYQLVRRHLETSRDLTGRRVLEIGCGRGGFSTWLGGQPNPPQEVVAVDYSSVAVEKGRAHAAAAGVTGVTWQTGDIQAIHYPDATFDTVISCETVEHVPDPFQAMKELSRVLKPGGRLFLTTPNYFGLTGIYRGYMRLTGRKYTEVGQPINQFTMVPRTLYWLFRVGLTAETISGEGHYVPFPGRSPIRLRWMDHAFLKWIALHVIVVARKPG